MSSNHERGTDSSNKPPQGQMPPTRESLPADNGLVNAPQGAAAVPRGGRWPAIPWTLPRWLVVHFNHGDMKTFLRCWIATWVSCLLIFIQPALDQLGTATFFAPLAIFIAPPIGNFASYLLAAMSIILGMCAAWVWGIITMKAALAARPASETLARLAALQQEALQRSRESGASLQQEELALIFNGYMLDARVTTVYFVMVCAFIYLLARLRMYNPRFTGAQIFGTIAVDLYLLFAPSQPQFVGDLASSLVTPGTIGIGLGLVCWLLLVPESTSYAVLAKLEHMLHDCNAALTATERHLRGDVLDLASLSSDHNKIISAWKATSQLMALLRIDISRCYWSSHDLIELYDLTQDICRKSLSLINLHRSRLSTAKAGDGEEVRHEEEKDNVPAASSVNQNASVPLDQHLLHQEAALADVLQTPESFPLNERYITVLRDTTSGLLKVCMSSVDVATRHSHKINTCRWVQTISGDATNTLRQEIEDNITELRSLRSLCVANTTDALLQVYGNLFDEHGNPLPSDGSRSTHTSLRGIITCMIFEKHITDMSLALEMLLERLSLLARERTECRFWIPITIQNIMLWLHATSSSGSSAQVSPTELDHEVLAETSNTPEAKTRARRIHLADHGQHRHQSLHQQPFLLRTLVTFWHWLTSTHGLYAARVVIISIATSIPAVLPNTAGFYYREKGIWAVITAQLTLAPYMADLVVSVFWRALSTVVGGLLALVAWYIGSGSGNGNPYGLGASTAVVTAILVWLRIWCPHTYVLGAVMAGATFSLTIGYSYDNSHLDEYGLIGKGFEVFWKRLVTVLAGLAAALVIQVLPTPPSATAHARRRLAKSIHMVCRQYSLLLHSQKYGDDSGAISAEAELSSLNLANSLTALSTDIHAVKVEISVGPFNRERLRALVEECKTLNQSLTRLIGTANALPPNLKRRFESATGILDDRVIGDVMAVLHIVQQTFISQSPLPPKLPTPLEDTFYDAWKRERHVMISKELIRGEGYSSLCIALSSYLSFLSTIDNIVRILAKSLGEPQYHYD